MGRFGGSEIIILIIILGGIAIVVNKNDSQNSKSSSVAYLLWFLSCFGILGFHRFYLGKIGSGLLWLISGGLVGIGAFFDLFTLGGQVDRYNTNMELKTIRATTLSNTQSIKNSYTNNDYLNQAENTKDSFLSPKTHQEKIEVLQSIKDLLDKGILTQEEFEKQKAQILS